MSKISTTFENGVVINVADDTTPFDIAEYIKANIDAWMGKPVIWDLSGMDWEHITNEELQQFAVVVAELDPIRRNEKTAMIASGNLAYGMTRMFGVFLKEQNPPVTFHIYRTIEEATDWLLL